VPLLRRRLSFSARSAAASVRALSLIGGEDALSALASYGAETRKSVIRELVTAWQSFDNEEYARRGLSGSPLIDGELQLQTAPETFAGLQYINNMTGISIDNCQRLRSLDGLRHARSLKRINLDRLTRVTDLSPLENISHLTDIYLAGLRRIKSIEPICRIKNLVNLTLRDGIEVSDLFAVKFFGKLETLNLTGFKKTVLDNSLPESIRKLMLVETKLGTFDVIGRCTNMTNLDLRDVGQPNGIEQLSLLVNLTHLTLEFPRICEELYWIKPLSGLKALRLLTTQGIKSFDPISNFLHLELLQITNATNIDCPTFIRNMSRLEKLTISGATNMSQLPPLANLQKLAELDLSGAKQICGVSEIASLQNLRTLYLTGCTNVTDVSPLRKLTNLQLRVVDPVLVGSDLRELAQYVYVRNSFGYQSISGPA
jgi:Leucine-rich repeat (LRR) protein